MKIGICTFHASHNYGAMLQAYALKSFLEQYNHEVSFVDYQTHLLASSRIKIKSLGKCTLKEKLLYPKYLIKWFIPTYVFLKKRERNFLLFHKKYLQHSRKDIVKYDVLIYGSDQIWSKYDVGFNKFMWGDSGVLSKRCIAFSASMGVVDNVTEEDIVFIRSALKRFDAVSVRELDLQQLLQKEHAASHLQIYRTIDPTLMLDNQIWSKIIKKRIIKEPYLLFYDFQIDPLTTKIVTAIASKMNLRIIRLTDGVEHIKRDNNYFRTAGPIEFLSLLKYADFVFSSSFHGAAFSIIFEKPFYVKQVWNEMRVKTLLVQCNLENRFIETFDDVDLESVIDYVMVKKSLFIEQDNAKQYLLNNI